MITAFPMSDSSIYLPLLVFGGAPTALKGINVPVSIDKLEPFESN
jgi:hypothetical protein